jgi:hypothetical protein
VCVCVRKGFELTVFAQNVMLKTACLGAVLCRFRSYRQNFSTGCYFGVLYLRCHHTLPCTILLKHYILKLNQNISSPCIISGLRYKIS